MLEGIHPTALYLLDIEACLRCKKTKFVLKDYELPEPESLGGSRVQNSSASVIPRKGARVKSEEPDQFSG